jgi:tetratricopeptide (TPR) repeat protein
MREGERCTITIVLNDGDTNAEHLLDLELVSFERAADIHSLSPSEKIVRALKLKDIGTAAFRSLDIQAAFYKFSRSLKYLACAAYDHSLLSGNAKTESVAVAVSDCRVPEHASPTEVPMKAKPPEVAVTSFTSEDHDRLACQCWLNLAACQLRCENFEMAKANCSRALDIDPHNVKGLYRRAQCSAKLNDECDAITDLEHALAIEPTNREVNKLLKTAREAVRRSDEKLARAMSKMFQ